MIITLKNLQQQSFTIEIEPEKLVKDLKEKIHQTKGDEYPVAGQKLIYAGKILADESPLSEYSIDEAKYIVVMVAKTKPTPAASTAAPKETAQTTATEASKGSVETKTESSQPPAQAPPSQPAESSLLSDQEFRRNVENIMAMGYDRSQVEKALRASFNNADRAVEYLISGIPDEVSQVSQSESDTSVRVRPSEASGGGSTGSPLDFLRTQPQFEQMRQVVRENPELLNALMQQIGQSNPDLLQMISQNQEEFVRLLNEDAGSGGNQNPDSQAAPFQIAVTSQDKEAIERLKSMGFPEHLVIEAYFACEKNETLAANFLLSGDGEED